jgi:uncharacterized phage-like protein YoqJ
MVCTFFGHKNCYTDLKDRLEEEICKLIEQGVTTFYVGNNGQFDNQVHEVLKKLQQTYPIDYAVVLAYPPTTIDEYHIYDYSDTLYPEGMEERPLRFAISYRNEWMINKCDYVICYITHSFGGAAQFVEKAKRKGKAIINLADD